MASLQITIRGDKEARDTLQKISKDFQDLSDPLTRSSKRYMSDIESNFNDRGTTFKHPWKPLSPATIAIKRRLYAEGKSIAIERPLVRTGAMRKSFGYELTGKQEAQIYNSKEYAEMHQEGGYAVYNKKQIKIPRRVLAWVDESRITSVSNIFTDWIENLISKYKAS